MYKNLILFFLLSFVSVSFSQENLQWAWVKPTGNTVAQPKKITVDAQGNTYVTGSFSGTVTFDSITISSINVFDDIFVMKYTADGMVAWVKKFAGNFIDGGRSIAIDSNGNVYVSGMFRSTSITFGDYVLTSGGQQGSSSNLFVTKLDQDGNVLWAKSAFSQGLQTYSNGLAVDNNGNVIVAGTYYNNFVFNGVTYPGDGGIESLFIVRYTSQGDLSWAQTSVGNSANALVTDLVGNVYVAGRYLRNGSLASLQFPSEPGIFLSKIDVNGNGIWLKTATGTTSSLDEYVSDLEIDSGGDLVMLGDFRNGSIRFDDHVFNATAGTSDIFIVKYTHDGTYSWGKSIQGTNEDMSVSLGVDQQRNIYVSGGSVSQSLMLDEFTLSSNNSVGSFFAKLDINGHVVLFDNLTSDEEGLNLRDIKVDRAGNIYASGICFEGTVFTGINPSLRGTFVGKLGDNVLKSIDVNKSSVKLYPNPAKDFITVEQATGTITSVTIYNTLGQQVHSENLHNIPGNTTVDISKLQAGYYLVEVGSGSEKSVFKVLKN